MNKKKGMESESESGAAEGGNFLPNDGYLPAAVPAPQPDKVRAFADVDSVPESSAISAAGSAPPAKSSKLDAFAQFDAVLARRGKAHLAELDPLPGPPTGEPFVEQREEDIQECLELLRQQEIKRKMEMQLFFSSSENPCYSHTASAATSDQTE
eukprot:NODE_5475_length_673_cov_17.134615_g5100_i0.p1 GENE.NODE_5475_length_673_cov_17.134615_g5100_i0~~NODE_5475_length_673_cov_17.134615_g5100_i0.p1  ORF type:complete len:175 (+),score=50.82 NODE_5475_length_673_cov_17.134615_g5100_i0:65-526(+)